MIRQDPLPGASVPAGSAVSVVLSTGPCPVTVPDVVGQPWEEVVIAIETAGLVVGTVTEECSDSTPKDSVISQSPLGGTQVLPGTAVDLVLSTGPCPVVTVPDVVGMTQSEASTALGNVGLVIGQVTQVCSPTVPIGTVISQNPGAGTEVNSGTEVDLVVSAGPCPEGEGSIEGDGQIEGEGVAEGEGETIPPQHSADRDGDGRISLSELLRCIQFFNIGGYHCAVEGEESEDGYVAGYEGDKSCRPYASDYNPQDWRISLSELLRLIQFFNMNGYYPCPESEDGYCPGQG